MSSPTEPATWPPERLRVGDCVVDVPLREVLAPGARRPYRVTPKALGVLLALARQPGRVVSREALLEEVWPDTLPTNDVVTQAITQLRKALDERRDAGNARDGSAVEGIASNGSASNGIASNGMGRSERRYIETIAKTGYRLLAPVVIEGSAPVVSPATSPVASTAVVAAPDEPVPDQPALDEPAPPAIDALPAATIGTDAADAGPRPRRRLRPLLIVAIACVAIVGLWLVGFALLRGNAGDRGTGDATARAWLPQDAPRGRPYRLITSTPGFEVNPTLSPDGAMVAYAASMPGRRGTAIMVQTTEPTAARALTRPDVGASDRWPAWSPDGRQIAFQRVGPEARCQVLVMPASGGAARAVAGCDAADMVSFTWTPDGSGLLFGSMQVYEQRAGIRVLDLASGRWRAIRYATAAHDLDYLPRYSPDGRWIVFVRNPQLGDLWRMPAAGGTPEPLTRLRVEIRGWDWLPDGRSLVFGRRVDAETRISRLDIASGELSDLGVTGAQLPSVAARANMLAFVHRRPLFGVFRFDLAPAAAGAPARRHLFASTGRDTQPSIAPDARQLVFSSDRSGRFSMWWADLQRPDSLRLIEGVQPDTRRLAEWSWDARRVLVAGTDANGRYGLYELDPASGQVERLDAPVPDPLQGLYLPDRRRLLVGTAGTDGRPYLALYDRTASPWRELARLDDVSLARVDPDRGRVLFTRLSGDGLWQAGLDLAQASVRRIDADYPSRWRYRNWDIARDGRILHVDQGAQCLSLLRQIATAEPPPEPRCLEEAALVSTNGLSVSGRGNALYVGLATADGTDIAYMALPEPPATGVPGWIK